MSAEEIQNMFPQTGFPSTEVPSSEDPQQLSNKNILKNEETNIYAPAVADAKSLPSSLSDSTKKTKPIPYKSVSYKERMESHPAYENFKKSFNIQLVGIDDAEHAQLIEKYGDVVVTQAYEYLADWKISKAAKDPKVLTKHTDTYRLKKWALKEVIANPQPVSKLASNRKWAIKMDSDKEDKNLLKYVMHSKPIEKEKAIALYYCQKNNITPPELLRDVFWNYKLTRGQVDELEKEMAQVAENQG